MTASGPHSSRASTRRGCRRKRSAGPIQHRPTVQAVRQPALHWVPFRTPFHAQRKTAKFCDTACRKAHSSWRGSPRTGQRHPRRLAGKTSSLIAICAARDVLWVPPSAAPSVSPRVDHQGPRGKWCHPPHPNQPRPLAAPEPLPEGDPLARLKELPDHRARSPRLLQVVLRCRIAYVIDHPEHKPVSDTKRRAEDRALREFENRLKAIQKRVLLRP